MKHVIAVLLLTIMAASAASNPPPKMRFVDDTVEIDIVSGAGSAAPVRRGDMVVFAANVTFKVAEPGDVLVPGTRALIYWSVICSKMLERHVVGAVTIPGNETVYVSTDRVIEAARSAPFVKIDTELGRQVAVMMCRHVK